MRTITKVGAVLFTAVTLLATVAYADPGNGKSEQWSEYIPYEWDPPAFYMDCLGETVKVYGIFAFRVNVHVTPAGDIGYTLQQGPAWENSVTLTVLRTGQVFYLKPGNDMKESGHGPWAVGGYWGTTVFHFWYEADNGDRLKLKELALWEPNPNPAPGELPWIFTKHVVEWTCHCK